MKLRVAFAWPELPDYAARCIARFIKETPELEVAVVATRPRLPIKRVEDSLGRAVLWVDASDSRLRWADLAMPEPQLVFQNGYSTKALRALGADCRSKGGSVALLTDHNWTGSFKHRVIDPMRHRLKHRHHYRWVVVPGRSGHEYHRRMGYQDNQIIQGFLGADEALFQSGLPIANRPKDLIFVGQLIERKNVLRLLEAFQLVVRSDPEWRLHICGSGPLRGRIEATSNILVHEFLQPPDIAKLMRNARALVLPSLDEHWGLVVHEAALSGCALLLSRVVGAVDDLARRENAILFDPRQITDIFRAIRDFSSWEEHMLRAAEATSTALADQFGPGHFASAFREIVRLSSSASSGRGK